MSSTKQPGAGGYLAVGVASLLLILFGAYFLFTDDVAIGAALVAIGAAITPSVAWWPTCRDGAPPADAEER